MAFHARQRGVGRRKLCEYRISVWGQNRDRVTVDPDCKRHLAGDQLRPKMPRDRSRKVQALFRSTTLVDIASKDRNRRSRLVCVEGRESERVGECICRCSSQRFNMIFAFHEAPPETRPCTRGRI